MSETKQTPGWRTIEEHDEGDQQEDEEEEDTSDEKYEARFEEVKNTCERIREIEDEMRREQKRQKQQGEGEVGDMVVIVRHEQDDECGGR